MGIEQKSMLGKQAKHAIELTYIMATINKPKVAHHGATTGTGPAVLSELGSVRAISEALLWLGTLP